MDFLKTKVSWFDYRVITTCGLRKPAVCWVYHVVKFNKTLLKLILSRPVALTLDSSWVRVSVRIQYMSTADYLSYRRNSWLVLPYFLGRSKYMKNNSFWYIPSYSWRWINGEIGSFWKHPAHLTDSHTIFASASQNPQRYETVRWKPVNNSNHGHVLSRV